jgi:hypothetical protein
MIVCNLFHIGMCSFIFMPFSKYEGIFLIINYLLFSLLFINIYLLFLIDFFKYYGVIFDIKLFIIFIFIISVFFLNI